jgi:hypothetical protein
VGVFAGVPVGVGVWVGVSIVTPALCRSRANSWLDSRGAGCTSTVFSLARRDLSVAAQWNLRQPYSVYHAERSHPMSKRSVLYVALTLCATLTACLVMSYAWRAVPASSASLPPDSVSGALTPDEIPVSTPEPSPTPVPLPTRTAFAGTPDPDAIQPYIPTGTQVVGTLEAELDGDPQPEVMVLLGVGGESGGLGYDHLEMMVLELDHAPDPVTWKSSPLVGERGEALQVRDINGDGRDEVLSYQSMGASGYTLYVIGWRDGAFGLLLPKGGYFGGQGHFGDAGVHLEDIDRDGVYEILASYGPAGTSTDVYRWDGAEYAFAITMQDK